jgi:SAM-dependent methyltransferase
MKDQLAKLQPVVDRLLSGKEGIRVLDAGCGSHQYVRFPTSAHVVGLDVSAQQLGRNSSVDEKILGDVQTYPLPADTFDVAICWWVLEHLPRPDWALRNLARAVKPGGIVILAVPNPLCLKGLVTKFTPYRLHVWGYRHILGFKLAGVDGREPFRTYLRFAVAPGAIRRFAQVHGLTIEYFDLYEDWKHRELRERFGLSGARWRVLDGLIRTLSLGRIDAGLTDYIVVLRKGVAATPPAPEEPALAQSRLSRR